MNDQPPRKLAPSHARWQRQPQGLSARRSRNSLTLPPSLPTVADEEDICYPLSPPPPPGSDARSAADVRSSYIRRAHSSLASSGLLPNGSQEQVQLSYQQPSYQQPSYQQPSYQQTQYPPQPPPALQKRPSRRIIHESASGPPSVYWSDDGASTTNTTTETATIHTIGTTGTASNPSAFTFYREGTPPPRGFDDDEDNEDNDDDDDDDDDENKDGERGLSSWVSRRKGRASQDNGGKDVIGAAVSTFDEPEERRTTADFEFVNGRYVPPGLREGRMPGRIPPGSQALGLEKLGRGGPGYGYGYGYRQQDGGTASGHGYGGEEATEYSAAERRMHEGSYWMAICIVAVILLIVIGVGVGVGVSLGRRG